MTLLLVAALVTAANVHAAPRPSGPPGATGFRVPSSFVLYLPAAFHNCDARYCSPGRPAIPIPYVSDWIPPGFLEYDETGFFVHSRYMHYRPVTVAFAKDVALSDTQRRAVAEFALDTWAEWWQVFGGFPWPSYTIVIRNSPRRSPAGEIGIGFEDDATHLIEPSDYCEFLGHGIFHAWWGNTVEHASSHVDPATPEAWSVEGFTQYYGDRAGGPVVYDGWMEGHWHEYQSIRGTQYDVPLFEMGGYAERTGDMEYRLQVYWKGALVAYMIDQRLHEQGLNLDHLMAYMYEQYGLTGRRYNTEDARMALEAITAEDWRDFFGKYIYGINALPLEGSFEYLEH
jgi:hypothetical protein